MLQTKEWYYHSKKYDPLLNFVEKEYKLLFKENNIIPVNQDTYNISKLKNILNI